MVQSHDRLVCNVFRISGKISRLNSPSVTFEFPAATGNQVMAGQYLYTPVSIISTIIDQSVRMERRKTLEMMLEELV